MITLTFNSTTRIVKVTNAENIILYTFTDVPTVQMRDGYYEVMQTDFLKDKEIKFPVCRLPVSQTIMLIQR